MRSLHALPVLFLVSSCGGESPPPPIAPKPPATSAPPVVEAPKKVTFENPGGMWMPHQLAAHKETLKSLGLEIDPAELTDPTSRVLGAVVSLGGCSASFVSSEGLLATNHHCVTGALQYNSTPQQNLLKDGYLARTRADEKWNGPAAKVWVTQKVSEVTPQVLDGIDKVKDDQARYKAIEAKQKELVAACEKGRPAIRCTVARFFEGERFYQIEQLELRDIRLVYAPAAGIGNYGGEIDNWRWPRHTGDVSFYRAYVGKDGQPADHAADNVPYKPQHFLKIASRPLAEGDLVYVAGYPARTNSLKTKSEVDEAVSFFYPRRQAECEDYLKVLHALAEKDKEVGIKATPMIRGFGNRLTNTKGQLEGLVKGGLAAQKAKMESELAAFIEADPQRKASYGGVLEDIAKAHAEYAKHNEPDADLRELAGAAKLVSAAGMIVRMAEERAKPDAERHPDYQERNWKRLEQSQVQLSKAYHRTLDKEMLALAASRIGKHEKGKELTALLGKDVQKGIDALFANTKLEDEKKRVELLNKATTAELKRSADPVIKLAVALRPLLKAAEDRDEAYAGKMALLKPRYIKALRELTGKDIAPDANGTLRVSYGTVRGYKPTPEAPMYRPFTVLSEVVAKNKDAEPFLAPPKLLEAARAKKVGPYVDAKLGEVPVDFLADLHITGGNSGSATLNAKGELTGLVFDGNYEAMASDWLFIPSITRSIHVDIRYVLWVMDAVDGADHLVKEMGGTPAID